MLSSKTLLLLFIVVTMFVYISSAGEKFKLCKYLIFILILIIIIRALPEGGACMHMEEANKKIKCEFIKKTSGSVS